MTRRARRTAATMTRVQHSGAEGEAFAESLHEHALALGIADVRKLPTPLRIIRPVHGGLLCVPQERSTVDYHGHMLDGTGRAVLVEAKRCRDARFNFKAQLKAHQRKALDDGERSGCVAALLVLYGPTAEPSAFPWFIVRAFIEAGAKSLGPIDMAAYRVKPGTSYLSRWVCS